MQQVTVDIVKGGIRNVPDLSKSHNRTGIYFSYKRRKSKAYQLMDGVKVLRSLQRHPEIKRHNMKVVKRMIIENRFKNSNMALLILEY